MNTVCGFSKLSKLEKLNFVVDEYLDASDTTRNSMLELGYNDRLLQIGHEQFSENTISNFHLPYGVATNFKINNLTYCVPMVTEESSVVAACSKSAKFWSSRGGFHAEVLGSIKNGQVHFYFSGNKLNLLEIFNNHKNDLLNSVESINENMKKRGGGILDIKLVDKTDQEVNYYQLDVSFDTCDAMGANFINTNLETLANKFQTYFSSLEMNIIFSIVSNYTPQSIVKAFVACPIKDLNNFNMPAKEFAERFQKAVKISQIDLNRAVTHNKGIMNGVDAVCLATGNDFRAIEASVHAFASQDGGYKGLTNISLKNDIFYYELNLPLSVGTIGGLTNLHPLSKVSLNMLGRPTSFELMQIMASVGLAQNFAAIGSLITTGIQKGHMKMHLINILNYFEADDIERENAFNYFLDKSISFEKVRNYLGSLRNMQ